MSDRILYIQTAFIGDAILSLPAIEKLHEKYQDSNIDVLCTPQSQDIFKSSPYITEVTVLDKKNKQKTLWATLKFAKELKSNNYTQIFSSHRSFRTGLIVLTLGTKHTFGFDNASLKHVYKSLIKYNVDKHEVQRNLDLIGFNYNDENWKIIPKIESSEEIKQTVLDYLNENNLKDGFIAIAPGSVWTTKRYPQNYFEELIERLIMNNNKIVLIGGKQDSGLCSSIKDKFESVIDSSGKFNIVGTVELLRYASLLISNDSAPTHMGMSADIKVLTIYCSTIPGFGFYPYNGKSRYISYDDLKCKPCGIHGHKKCPIKTFDCVKKLNLNYIIKNIGEMLSGD